MGCRIYIKGRKFRPYDIGIIEQACSDFKIKKYYNSGRHHQLNLNQRQQYEIEKKCLLALESNFEDICNIGYYPFPKILLDDPEFMRCTLSFCGNSVKQIRDNTLLKQKILPHNKIPTNFEQQIKTIVYNLKKNNIYNLDIKQANTCINNNRVFLIDFNVSLIDDNDIVNYVYKNEPRSRDRDKWFINQEKQLKNIIKHLKQPDVSFVLPITDSFLNAKEIIFNICNIKNILWDGFIIGDNSSFFVNNILNDYDVNIALETARRCGNLIHAYDDFALNNKLSPSALNHSKDKERLNSACRFFNNKNPELDIISYAKNHSTGERFFTIKSVTDFNNLLSLF